MRKSRSTAERMVKIPQGGSLADRGGFEAARRERADDLHVAQAFRRHKRG